MIRWTPWVVIVVLVPVLALPLCVGAGDKGKEDPLIAGMKFVKVPKGMFWMRGGSHGPPTEQVEIKADFEMAAYTVTQEQWQAVMGSNPSFYSRVGKGKDDVKDIADADLKRFPVETVSWNDVQEFLKKLNEQQKGQRWLYRLPTEAEWEYACRGAATSKEECSFDFYFEKPMNDLSSTQANFRGSEPAGKGAKGPSLERPTKVGAYAPNKLGLYDMHGNVRQLCDDLWTASVTPARMVRGSAWGESGRAGKAGTLRGGLAPTYREQFTGFRLLRVSSGVK